MSNPPIASVSELPRDFNAASLFIRRHVAEGNGARTAFIDDAGSYTYADLTERVNRASNLLRSLGLRQEDRVLLCLVDTIDFPTMFWGAIQAGIVPIPANTLLTTQDYGYLIHDSRARALVVSDVLYEKFAPILNEKTPLEHVLVSGAPVAGRTSLSTALASASSADPGVARTTRDDVAFWLYSSGSTGAPKGVMHMHQNVVATSLLMGWNTLGVRPNDVMFSAPKLFFAYGLGNAMTFPLLAGATSVLMKERATPEAVMRVLAKHNPTIFFGVPTLYASMLAAPADVRAQRSKNLRVCVSAGEALPPDLGTRWESEFKTPVLDGLGCTEMLQTFLSNRPDDVRYGTSGKPVAGYELRVVDENGAPVPAGEMGELVVSGPSSAVGYWNQREKSLRTFRGAWTHTGDKYFVDTDGYYHYAGRADDMLKVSGNWVSPVEVEATLIAHPAVLEAAVIGAEDRDGLIKPRAYVVLKSGHSADEKLTGELQQFVKARLAPYKYPRWIQFTDNLPKTATGKIQRFKLRTEARP